MIFKETLIPGVYLIYPELLEDSRGAFTRTFCDVEFERIGVSNMRFKQINHSYNLKKGTFRGIHYQKPPYSEGKLIRCIAGRVKDIVVDLRKGSKTCLKNLQVELSADNRTMIYLPEGIAHGFITLEDSSELIYHHTVSYHPEYNTGVNIKDPLLSIDLSDPIDVISEKDVSYQFLNQDFEGITI